MNANELRWLRLLASENRGRAPSFGVDYGNLDEFLAEAIADQEMWEQHQDESWGDPADNPAEEYTFVRDQELL